MIGISSFAMIPAPDHLGATAVGTITTWYVTLQHNAKLQRFLSLKWRLKPTKHNLALSILPMLNAQSTCMVT